MSTVTEPQRVTPVLIPRDEDVLDQAWFAGFFWCFFAVMVGVGIVAVIRIKEKNRALVAELATAYEAEQTQRDNFEATRAEHSAVIHDRDALALENGRLRRKLFEATQPEVTQDTEEVG